MLDLKFIRENVDVVREAIKNKREKADVDALINLDVERRDIIGKVEASRAEQNRVTNQIADMKKNKQDATDIIAEMKNLSADIKALNDRLREVEKEIHDIQIWIPNIPHPSCPVGGEDQNELVRTWGEIPEVDFKPLPHHEIAEN